MWILLFWVKGDFFGTAYVALEGYYARLKKLPFYQNKSIHMGGHTSILDPLGTLFCVDMALNENEGLSTWGSVTSHTGAVILI